MSLFQWFMMCDCVHVLVSAVLLQLASKPEVTWDPSEVIEM